MVRLLVLSNVSAGEAAAQLAALDLKEAELSFCASLPSHLEPEALAEAIRVVAQAVASKSANGAHFDGMLALGTAGSLCTAMLAMIESADRTIASIETNASALPAGQQKVDAKKDARMAAEATAWRSRVLRPRFVVLFGPTDGCHGHFSADPLLASRLLSHIDAAMAEAGAMEGGGGDSGGLPLDTSPLDQPYTRPLGTKTKVLLVCGAASTDAGRAAADGILFGGAHFLLTHGSTSELPSNDDAPALLKIRNFIKVGMPDELIAGCTAWYEHRRLGWLEVSITRVDYQGVADGGATYCIKAVELDGEVETVRTRLRLARPEE